MGSIYLSAKKHTYMAQIEFKANNLKLCSVSNRRMCQRYDLNRVTVRASESPVEISTHAITAQWKFKINSLLLRPCTHTCCSFPLNHCITFNWPGSKAQFLTMNNAPECVLETSICRRRKWIRKVHATQHIPGSALLHLVLFRRSQRRRRLLLLGCREELQPASRGSTPLSGATLALITHRRLGRSAMRPASMDRPALCVEMRLILKGLQWGPMCCVSPPPLVSKCAFSNYT
jgi:hypothetical protein